MNGEEFIVQAPRVLTIGRHSESDIRFENSTISRRHAVLRPDAQGWLLEDAGSRNGIFCDGSRISLFRISTAVSLRFGDPKHGNVLELIPIEGEPPVGELTPADNGRADEANHPAPDVPAAGGLGTLTSIHQPRQGSVRIGRARTNDIVIEDLLVSRHHAELRRDLTRGYELVDLDSHNGTFINGQRITQAALNEFDVITIGHHLFRLVEGELEEYVDTGEVSFEALDLSVVKPNGQLLLNDVSFSLKKCSFMAVVGPSGAGKSTLLNALTGFRPADSGAVFYAGRDLYASYEDLCQRIGYVPQDDILHPQLTIRRALEFAAELRFPPDVSRQDRQQRVSEVMTELGLSDRADLPIQQLSGGQRKRTSIAVELLTKPSVLILDEPTSGLDPGFEKAVMELLRELADGGRTVVVVTHSVQSLDLCDRVLFLASGGKAAYFGPPHEALAYFAVRDYADVFAALDQDQQTDWQARFRQHAAYGKYVRQSLLAGQHHRWQSSPDPLTPCGRHNWLQQFSTLTRRYLAVMVSDRRNLAMLLLQAPVLGVLIFAALPPNILNLDHPIITPPVPATTVALIVVLSITWMGASNAIREIVKELAIYRRERLTGLSISAYIASKILVLATVTAAQAVILILIALQRQHGPQSATALGWPLGELIVDTVLAGFAAMTLGLLISSLVSTADKALTLLPVLLIPQLILAGPVLPITNKPVLKELSYLASAQWGVAAVASTVDTTQLRKLQTGGKQDAQASSAEPPDRSPEQPEEDHPRWAHTSSAWLKNIAFLVAFDVVGVVGVWLLLYRRDPLHAHRKGRNTTRLAKAGKASAHLQQ